MRDYFIIYYHYLLYIIYSSFELKTVYKSYIMFVFTDKSTQKTVVQRFLERNYTTTQCVP